MLYRSKGLCFYQFEELMMMTVTTIMITMAVMVEEEEVLETP